MSVFSQILKTLYGKLFPQESRRTFSEEPTRPLDAAALARALAGEGRRHVSTGYASYSAPGNNSTRDSLYLLVGNSDGLNAIPDFGFVGVANSPAVDNEGPFACHVALSVFSNQIIGSALIDFLEFEGFEETTSLQNTVVDAMRAAEYAVDQRVSGMNFSLTAGLVFAEIIIIGHRGTNKAYHLDRHHIEMITVSGWQGEGDKDKNTSLSGGIDAKGELDQIEIFSRPVPRDGYILLCTDGLWKNIEEQGISRIVMDSDGPQEGCEALINQAKNRNPDQNASAILLYFPPDFGSWR